MNSTRFFVKNSSINVRKTKLDEKAKNPPNPRIKGGLDKADYSLSKVNPVGVIHTHNINSLMKDQELPKLTHPSKKDEVVKQSGNSSKTVSILLRSHFKALVEIDALKASSTLAHITVNFTSDYSRSLLTGNKSEAKAYARKITDRFKAGFKGQNLKSKPNFFLILEDSEDLSLHAHIIMSYQPDDESLLRAMFKVEAKKGNEGKSSVKFQTSYTRKHELNQYHSNRTEYELSQLDLEHDEAMGTDYFNYPETRIVKHEGKPDEELHYATYALDVGIVDYLSKDLNKPFQSDCAASDNTSNSRKIYVSHDISSRAKQTRKDNYKKYCELKEQREAEGQIEAIALEQGFKHHTEQYTGCDSPLQHQDQKESYCSIREASEPSQKLSLLQLSMQSAIKMHNQRLEEGRRLGKEIAALLNTED